METGFALGDKPEWFDQARCMGMDIEVFYGEEEDQQERGSHRPYLLPAEVAQAKAMCRDCPVREQCLEYALDNDERHGIWGGLTTKERRKLARVNRWLAS